MTGAWSVRTARATGRAMLPAIWAAAGLASTSDARPNLRYRGIGPQDTAYREWV